MEGRSVSSTHAVMSEVMQPGDANFHGKVFGGRLLSLVDLCAYVCATRFAGEVCVTAAFDQVDFHEPIEVGEVVTLSGHVTYAGRTSMEVTIEVVAENIFSGAKRHTNTARVTMVAVREGKPVPIPTLICETREDKIHFLQGKLRKETRGKLFAERQRAFERFAQAADADLDEMLTREFISEA